MNSIPLEFYVLLVSIFLYVLYKIIAFRINKSLANRNNANIIYADNPNYDADAAVETTIYLIIISAIWIYFNRKSEIFHLNYGFSIIWWCICVIPTATVVFLLNYKFKRKAFFPMDENGNPIR